MLINRLTAHALGEADPQTGKPVELSPTQVRSIEILLKKSLPDLTATEITSVETRGLDDLSTEEILAMLQDHRMGGSKGDEKAAIGYEKPRLGTRTLQGDEDGAVAHDRRTGMGVRIALP
jgi:hypothetical protein